MTTTIDPPSTRAVAAGGPLAPPVKPTRRQSSHPDPRAAAQQLWQRLVRIIRSARGFVSAVTPLGWAVAVAAALMWLVSRLTGWIEFSMAAVALAAAFLVACVFIVGRARYRVRIDLRTQRVVVGMPAFGSMLVGHAGGRRLLPVRMELPIGDAVESVRVPRLGTGEEHEEAFRIPTERRGVIALGPARSVRGDGLGLLRRVVNWTEPELLYVHPRTVSLFGAAPGYVRDLEGQATRQLSDNDVSFHALRAYVPGDDRRYIHWKTSARTGQWMVRQFEETRRSHLVVALSNNLDDYADPEEFEIAISAGASLGVQSFKEQRELSVVTGSGVLKAPTARRLLDDMSAMDLAAHGTGIAGVARAAATRVSDVSVAIVLCGSVPSPTELRRAANAFPIGVRIIAVRVALGAAPTVRRIGSLPVVTVGTLAELPRALRAVGA